MSAGSAADRTLTVVELAQVLRWTLDLAFPGGVWVAGEISSLSRPRSGHVYFDLVERSSDAEPGAAPQAAVSVVLFRSDKDRVNEAVRQHGNAVRMADGLGVRIQGMLDFYPPRGQMQLRMTTIDPAYTLGAMAADREVLLRVLAAEGLLRRNAAAALAPVPLRVALATSLGSAAHADVIRVLAGSGFAFQVHETDTPVQGIEAPEAIASAVDAAAHAGVDVVILARGGGSRTDLAAFDNEAVGRAIAGCEIPVFTGIGHETDRSVADETAHTACSTPTAAARAVVQRVEEWLERLDETGRSIASRSRRVLAAAEHQTGQAAADTARDARGAARRAEHTLDTAAHRLVRAGRSATAHAGVNLDTAAHRLVRAGRSATAHAGVNLDTAARRLVLTGPAVERRAGSRLDRASARLSVAGGHELRLAQRNLDAAATRVRALDPALILRRGWSLTRRGDGTLVRSARDASPGDSIVTHLSDGTLDSTIRSRHVNEEGR